MSSLALIFFFIFLSMHACNAHPLGFVVEDHVDFLAKVSAENIIYVYNMIIAN